MEKCKIWYYFRGLLLYSKKMTVKSFHGTDLIRLNLIQNSFGELGRDLNPFFHYTGPSISSQFTTLEINTYWA
jgi:hypothetical protein